MFSLEDDLRRMNTLEQCQQHTSQLVLITLENLKTKLADTRSSLEQTLSSSVSKEILTEGSMISKRANDEISSALKTYHVHISKLNRNVDRALDIAAESQFQNFSGLFPQVECKIGTFGTQKLPLISTHFRKINCSSI